MMQNILDALNSYKLGAKLSNTDLSNIDTLINIIDLSIYNKIRYGDIMSQLKMNEYKIIYDAFRYINATKSEEDFANMFSKMCSIPKN
jgi:hypothetical protein